eukprot:scaffold8971_cov114-Isochrysis_galbana.AAC.3
MDIHSSPKRPRDPAQDNKVSQRATPFAPAKLEIQIVTTESCPGPGSMPEPARALHITPPLWVGVSTRPSHPPQPCKPEIIGRAPGEKVKARGEKGGNASPPEDSSSRVSCRIRPLAHLILKKNFFPLSEKSQSRNTTTNPAARLGNHGNSAIQAAAHLCGLSQTTPTRASTSTRDPDTSLSNRRLHTK